MVHAYDPHCDEAMLNRAYVFSMQAHGSQTRKNGDPYFTHPLAVAAILAGLKADPPTIITALLHDTVEDTDTTIEDIETQFGEEIARLVDGVTKLSMYELTSPASKQAENFQKFVLAMAKDVRVLLVKLADRLHNMRTLHHIPKQEKRERIALETIQIYAPLAGRIGVQSFREELEDLSFRHINPDGYESISDALDALAESSVSAVVSLSQTLKARLAEAGIKAETYSRQKRPFSIWNKMRRKSQGFEELADIYAFRLLVDSPADCYAALGVIHRAFKAIPHEFDDYISVPKSNNYQSIHTAVLVPVDDGGVSQKVEVQIRSKEMHETAERGIAAHWRYKAATKADSSTVEIQQPDHFDPYEWARNAVEMLQSGSTADEFLEHAKRELFQDQVFCFTPKGRVVALPAGATALDFAYTLHTAIGDSCVGATINKVNRPLRTPLKNGDVVKILRSDDAPIPKDWESLAVTSRAKAGVRRRIKELRQQEQIELGQRIIEAELAHEGFELTRQGIRQALVRLGYKTVNAVYQAVGALELPASAVRDALYPEAGGNRDRPVSATGRVKGSVPIRGLTAGVSVQFSSCCSPLPGERIVGIPGEDATVQIHRIDCPQLAQYEDRAEDWLDLRWRDDSDTDFAAPILVTVTNRIGALAHVSDILSRYEGDITNIRLQNREVDFHDILIDVLVRDVRHLNNILTALRASDTVIRAERIDQN